MNRGSLGVRLQVDPPGVLHAEARPDPVIVMHYGRPVEIGCERGGQGHFGLSVHGDVDIVPAGIASEWTLKKRDCALVIRLPHELLREAATELGIAPSDAVLRNRFQIRDAKIEHLGWALKTEMDHGFSSGRLYMDSIGLAMACRLLQGHSLAHPTNGVATKPGAISGLQLRRVLGYIEENLSGDLSLAVVAAVGGLSSSHFQRAFSQTAGSSVHRYVVRRRVERARTLLAERKLSLSEVALTVGFSHQSHLAYHMRRVFGVTPMEVRKAGAGEDNSA